MKIVILSLPRTGSTFLSTQISNISPITYAGEITRKEVQVFVKKGKAKFKFVEPNPERYIENFKTLLSADNYVVKVMLYFRYTVEMLEQLIDDLNADRIIYCKRDFIDSMISLNDAQQTGIWNLIKAKNASNLELENEDIKWQISDKEILAYYNTKKDWDTWVLGKPNIEILNYTDDLISYRKWIKRNGFRSKINIRTTVKLSSVAEYVEKKKYRYNVENERIRIQDLIGV